jgi:hypothetical protein
MIQMRYVPGRFVDCRFCYGKGCLACDGEADAAYKREFPDGPQPILTIKYDDPEGMEKLRAVLGNFVEVRGLATEDS